MKDWKSELMAIKIQPSKTKQDRLIKDKSGEKTRASNSSYIKPLDIEKKMLSIIRQAEDLTAELNEMLLLPLAKGNSKKIKQSQNEIKALKTQFTNLAYKFKPSLIEGVQVPNTNALMIEMKDELLQREDRYQNMLLEEIKVEQDKKKKEIEAQREEEQKIRQQLKEELAKKALSLIKEYKLDTCSKCDGGNIYSLCDACFGTKRLSQPREGLITERFTCANLKPNCQFCGGLGFFSKQRKGMTYECDKCTNGKLKSRCPSCMGTQINIQSEGALSKLDLINELQGDLELLREIQEFVGIR